jgi:small GTP-binding protein
LAILENVNKEQANPMHMDDDSAEKWRHADEEVRKNLPPGVKLVRTLREHQSSVSEIAWSPDGRMLASSSSDGTILLWDAETGECLHMLEGHKGEVWSVAFDPSGRMLASGGDDETVKLWDSETGECISTLRGHDNYVNCVVFNPLACTMASVSETVVKIWDLETHECISTLDEHTGYINSVAFDPAGRTLASGSDDKTVKLWNLETSECINTLKGHKGVVWDVAFDPAGRTLASGSDDKTVKLWETVHGKLLRTLEGHTEEVLDVSFLTTGMLLGSKSFDETIRIWRVDTGEPVAIIPEVTNKEIAISNLIFHPSLQLLASVGSGSDELDIGPNNVIYIYELDPVILLGQSTAPTIAYTSAKVVLVGDSGVGKTGLGWRLAHGEFKEHSSTHGQQFWLLNQLCKQRSDGTQCEAVLWDLAGQPDYRLIHALFLDDADLALLLFDPTRNDDSLSGVEFWLKQLKAEAQPPSGTPTVLVAARSDRGSPRLTQRELNAFCKDRGLKAFLLTSAKSGDGIEELVKMMQNMIPWDDKPATVTTETFKRIKNFVLDLKEKSRRRKMILTPKELRQRLEKTDRKWKFSDAEMMTAVGHLENHGYVKRLKTSKGEPRILLAPELLNNLAASFVLEARRNQEGLGSLEEQRLLSGEYKFPELKGSLGLSRISYWIQEQSYSLNITSVFARPIR